MVPLKNGRLILRARLALVKTEKLCKYMLFNESSRPLEQPVPECGTEEAEGMSCCADMGGS